MVVNTFKSIIFFLIVAIVIASDSDNTTNPYSQKILKQLKGISSAPLECAEYSTLIIHRTSRQQKTVARVPSNGQSVSFAHLSTQQVVSTHLTAIPVLLRFYLLWMGALRWVSSFMDTTNKIYIHALQLGDMLICVSTALVHYQYNSNSKKPYMALPAFGSALCFLFGLMITSLSRHSNTDITTIQKIKAALAAQA